jgi:hypothetical protein
MMILVEIQVLRHPIRPFLVTRQLISLARRKEFPCIVSAIGPICAGTECLWHRVLIGRPGLPVWSICLMGGP